jgi:hypothetical protein
MTLFSLNLSKASKETGSSAKIEDPKNWQKAQKPVYNQIREKPF